MPSQFAQDIFPDVTGRNLGLPNKRYDLYARNIDFTGTFSGPGLQQWSIDNPLPDSDSISISSDTGTGGDKQRMRMGNDAGQDDVDLEFTNLKAKFGSEQDANGGSIVMEFLSGALETAGDPYMRFYRRGQASGGIPAAVITNNGEFISNALGYATTVMRTFNYGDAQPRFQLDASGAIKWGPGGTTALDAGIARSSPATVDINDAQGSYAALNARYFASFAPVGTPPIVALSDTVCPNLNADKLDGFDWSAPDVIGDVTRNNGYFTTVDCSLPIALHATPPIVCESAAVVPNLCVSNVEDIALRGIFNVDTTALKAKRFSTGSIPAGTRANVICPWNTAFPTANYTISATMFDSANTGSAQLSIERVTAQATDHVTVQVFNQGGGARTGTIHIIAIRES